MFRRNLNEAVEQSKNVTATTERQEVSQDAYNKLVNEETAYY